MSRLCSAAMWRAIGLMKTRSPCLLALPAACPLLALLRRFGDRRAGALGVALGAFAPLFAPLRPAGCRLAWRLGGRGVGGDRLVGRADQRDGRADGDGLARRHEDLAQDAGGEGLDLDIDLLGLDLGERIALLRPCRPLA